MAVAGRCVAQIDAPGCWQHPRALLGQQVGGWALPSHERAGGRTPSCPQPLNKPAMLHALRGRAPGWPASQAEHAPSDWL